MLASTASSYLTVLGIMGRNCRQGDMSLSGTKQQTKLAKRQDDYE